MLQQGKYIRLRIDEDIPHSHFATNTIMDQNEQLIIICQRYMKRPKLKASTLKYI